MPRSKPFVTPELIETIAKTFSEQTIEREKSRLSVFNRAWSLATDEQKVTLAIAYLGGTGK